jgi:orotidine-5'-phosphate decarboxylase
MRLVLRIMNRISKIILALDATDISSVCSMIEQTKASIAVYKLGLEFYLFNGKAGVKEVQNRFPGIELFLDLKLHDIPNTVKQAANTVAELAPRFLTVHASGGAEMINSAALALPNTQITAVTVLTSLDEGELGRMGLPANSLKLAVDLALNATKNGARAVVCSPLEVAAIRAAAGPDITLITPGVRPNSAAEDDQKRTATPQAAIESGADYVVIGRPITQSQNPASAAAEIYSSM